VSHIYFPKVPVCASIFRFSHGVWSQIGANLEHLSLKGWIRQHLGVCLGPGWWRQASSIKETVVSIQPLPHGGLVHLKEVCSSTESGRPETFHTWSITPAHMTLPGARFEWRWAADGLCSRYFSLMEHLLWYHSAETGLWLNSSKHTGDSSLAVCVHIAAGFWYLHHLEKAGHICIPVLQGVCECLCMCDVALLPIVTCSSSLVPSPVPLFQISLKREEY
jgi:hypothetical protein